MRAVAAAEEAVARITAARADANSDDEHDPEGATIGFERAQAESLRASALRRLTEIDAACARLDAGTYGDCEVCGAAIPDARLAARPTATRCLAHA